jgi:hypothetical protein
MTKISASSIWRAISESKCTFFAWLVLHDRVLTPENMAKKNWPCNSFCTLCLCINETTSHLLTQCNYTEATWNLVVVQFNLPNFDMLGATGGPLHWVQVILNTSSRKEKREKLGILFTFWWPLWKERNRRTFDHKETSTSCLASMICDTIRLHLVAFATLVI